MPVFLFPGQGSQKAGAAKLFYEGSVAARSVLERAIALLPDDVTSVLLEGEQDVLNYTRNAQPILVCLEIAIATHLMEIGVQPEICTGHSLGEISALRLGRNEFRDNHCICGTGAVDVENVPEGGWQPRYLPMILSRSWTQTRRLQIITALHKPLFPGHGLWESVAMLGNTECGA